MNVETLAKVMRYDARTGKFYALRRSPRRKVGSTLGYIRPDGYRMIYVSGRWQYAHRLAWLFTTGRMPEQEIDHINGCRDDNRISNLRECTRSENMRNTKKRGICFHIRQRKWQASIRVNGKRIHLGSFETQDEAQGAYNEAVLEYHGEFARVSQPSEQPKQESML